jgi:hypothetical protein
LAHQHPGRISRQDIEKDEDQGGYPPKDQQGIEDSFYEKLGHFVVFLLKHKNKKTSLFSIFPVVLALASKTGK